jgi:hypothetical protein
MARRAKKENEDSGPDLLPVDSGESPDTGGMGEVPDGSPPSEDASSATPRKKRRTKAEMEAAKASRPPVDVPPAIANGLYDILGQLEVWGIVTALKLTGERVGLASTVFRYSDSEKAALAGPTCKVLGKYVPMGATKYADEMELAMLLFSLHMQKYEYFKSQLVAMEKPVLQ